MPALQGLAVALPLSSPLRLGLAPLAASGSAPAYRKPPGTKPREAIRGVFLWRCRAARGWRRLCGAEARRTVRAKSEAVRSAAGASCRAGPHRPSTAGESRSDPRSEAARPVPPGGACPARTQHL